MPLTKDELDAIEARVAWMLDPIYSCVQNLQSQVADLAALVSRKPDKPPAGPSIEDINRALLEGTMVLSQSGAPAPPTPLTAAEVEQRAAERQARIEEQIAARQARAQEQERQRQLQAERSAAEQERRRLEQARLEQARTEREQQAVVPGAPALTRTEELWAEVALLRLRRDGAWLKRDRTIRLGRCKGTPLRDVQDRDYLRWILTSAEIRPGLWEVQLLEARIVELGGQVPPRR